MEFSKLSESTLSRAKSKPELQKENYFMAHGNVLLYLCGPAHSLSCDWLLVFELICLCMNIRFNWIVATWSCICSPGPLNWDTFRSAVLPDMRIRLGVSWLWWQLAKAIWHGFEEAGIHVTSTKTCTLWASQGPPGSNPLWKGEVYCLAPEALFF